MLEWNYTSVSFPSSIIILSEAAQVTRVIEEARAEFETQFYASATAKRLNYCEEVIGGKLYPAWYPEVSVALSRFTHIAPTLDVAV